MKNKFWRIIFLLLSTVYLIPEIIFNSQIVSLMGLGTPEKSQLEHLEVFGRAVSGIGVTLLVADILPVRFFRNFILGCITLAITTVIIWPIVYHGQKYLVENLLIEQSTPEQRQYAVYSAVLRDALAINAIEIEGVYFDPKHIEDSENLTFIGLLGGLLYADHNLAGNLDKYKRNIIYNYIQQRVYRDFDRYYDEFGVLYDQLSSSYKNYAEGSNKFTQALVDSSTKEEEYWVNVEQEINLGWKKYQDAQRAHKAKASVRAQEYGPEIHKYFVAIERCKNIYGDKSNQVRLRDCIEPESARYKTMINKAGLGYIEPDYWVVTEVVSTTENLTKTAIGAVLTGGVSVGIQVLDRLTGGDGGIKKHRYYYTSNPDHYQKKISQHPKFIAMFTNETGYPIDIENLAAFRKHAKTQKKLRAALRKKGLDLPGSWHVNDRKTFSKSVFKKIESEAQLKWRTELAKKGMNLPVNLSWERFQLHPEIQNKISEHMGELYVPNVRSDWSKNNFKEFVLEPNIQKRTQQLLSMLAATEKEFTDGGRYSEQAKQGLRSIIIPPISMSLSLFLIGMMLIKIPVKTLQLLLENKNIKYKKTIDNLNKNKLLSYGINVLVKVIPATLLLALPIIFLENNYTKHPQSPVNHFLAKVEESGNVVFSYALRWTLHAQPLLHPVGVKLEKYTKIYEKFGILINQIDKSDLNEKSLEPSNTSIFIKTNVIGANIKIMNIKPKYQLGMSLEPGRYDILVSAPNYHTYRKWHDLSAGEQRLTIKLERRR